MEMDVGAVLALAGLGEYEWLYEGACDAGTEKVGLSALMPVLEALRPHEEECDNPRVCTTPSALTLRITREEGRCSLSRSLSLSCSGDGSSGISPAARKARVVRGPSALEGRGGGCADGVFGVNASVESDSLLFLVLTTDGLVKEYG